MADCPNGFGPGDARLHRLRIGVWSLHPQPRLSWWVPTLMALTIYGGSVEFVIANMLTQAFNPLTVLVITLVVGFRQFFYSIAMLGKYKGHGFQKFFQIFSLTDETFVVNYQLRLGDDVDHQRVYTMVAALDYFYWVFGTWLGGTLGSILAIQIKGLDFAMTALFLVLALDQILKEKSHVSSVSGLGMLNAGGVNLLSW